MTRPIQRHLLLLAVTAAGIFAIVASGGGGGGGGTPIPATTGAISVSMGFGAVSTPPYQCTGGGSVTITPVALTGTAGNGATQTTPYSYSSLSSTTSNEPACQQSLLFGNLRPGSWRVSDGTTTCSANVVAGQSTTVKIWNRVCQ